MAFIRSEDRVYHLPNGRPAATQSPGDPERSISEFWSTGTYSEEVIAILNNGLINWYTGEVEICRARTQDAMQAAANAPAEQYSQFHAWATWLRAIAQSTQALQTNSGGTFRTHFRRATNRCVTRETEFLAKWSELNALIASEKTYEAQRMHDQIKLKWPKLVHYLPEISFEQETTVREDPTAKIMAMISDGQIDQAARELSRMRISADSQSEGRLRALDETMNDIQKTLRYWETGDYQPAQAQLSKANVSLRTVIGTDAGKALGRHLGSLNTKNERILSQIQTIGTQLKSTFYPHDSDWDMMDNALASIEVELRSVLPTSRIITFRSMHSDLCAKYALGHDPYDKALESWKAQVKNHPFMDFYTRWVPPLTINDKLARCDQLLAAEKFDQAYDLLKASQSSPEFYGSRGDKYLNVLEYLKQVYMQWYRGQFGQADVTLNQVTKLAASISAPSVRGTLQSQLRRLTNRNKGWLAHFDVVVGNLPEPNRGKVSDDSWLALQSSLNYAVNEARNLKPIISPSSSAEVDTLRIHQNIQQAFSKRDVKSYKHLVAQLKNESPNHPFYALYAKWGETLKSRRGVRNLVFAGSMLIMVAMIGYGLWWIWPPPPPPPPTPEPTVTTAPPDATAIPEGGVDPTEQPTLDDFELFVGECEAMRAATQAGDWSLLNTRMGEAINNFGEHFIPYYTKAASERHCDMGQIIEQGAMDATSRTMAEDDWFSSAQIAGDAYKYFEQLSYTPGIHFLRPCACATYRALREYPDDPKFGYYGKSAFAALVDHENSPGFYMTFQNMCKESYTTAAYFVENRELPPQGNEGNEEVEGIVEPEPSCQAQSPQLREPDDRATSYVNWNNVTFRWLGGSLCADQHWQVMIDGSSNYCLASNGFTTTCFMPASTGEHRWYVVAMQDGEVVEGSQSETFVLNLRSN